jgi:hypothetical protein
MLITWVLADNALPALHSLGDLPMYPAESFLYNTQPCGEQGGAALSSNELVQLYDLANSILVGCKNSAPLSALNTTIDQFHEALDQRPAPDSLENCYGPCSKISHINQREDLDDALFLLCVKVQHQ